MTIGDYRLLKRHQRLDDRLRLAQALRFPDSFEITRLQNLKQAIKDRLARPARYRSAAR